MYFVIELTMGVSGTICQLSPYYGLFEQFVNLVLSLW